VVKFVLPWFEQSEKFDDFLRKIECKQKSPIIFNKTGEIGVRLGMFGI
jgi:hypothetical protein